MKTSDALKSVALKTIRDEAAAINALTGSIDGNFLKCVRHIVRAKGRVVVTGIGKSAIIGQKIVATFNSTGTPAIFMHAADAIHGDLGIIQKDDIIICISKSGETPEIKVLVPLLKQLGSLLISIVGNTASYLALQSDYVINTTVSREAGPNNLIPTSSTTAQLVIGDALAICLLNARGFTAGDFAKFHPGGALGKQMYLKVSDLYVHNQKPMVKTTDGLNRVILEISSKRLGATAVLKGNKLTGIITDGDLRRMLEKGLDLRNLRAIDVMSPGPKTIRPSTLVIEALSIMRKNNITQLLVIEKSTYKGVIHLHDILKEGII
ncbi:MAG: KpsF/GutQ family sugar-phosphate isomerase [Bacteroidetes bacterium]|nr:MAG: KpsF/GutQ family sugar-phosphate isomerase [Bacteroidota bacterium]